MPCLFCFAVSFAQRVWFCNSSPVVRHYHRNRATLEISLSQLLASRAAATAAKDARMSNEKYQNAALGKSLARS
jgi:hypothetical protein